MSRAFEPPTMGELEPIRELAAKRHAAYYRHGERSQEFWDAQAAYVAAVHVIEKEHNLRFDDSLTEALEP